MVNSLKMDSLNFLYLFILGYIIYIWIIPSLCLEWSCFWTFKNIVWVLIAIIYVYLVIRTLNWIKSDEELEREVRKLQKEKLKIEIEKLKKKR